jgi:hypothetical protein
MEVIEMAWVEVLTEALVPVLFAAFAIQRLLDISDPVVDKAVKNKIDRKIVLGILSFFAGFILAFGCGIRVLLPLGIDASILDGVITALIISAGTEGSNSLMKILSYSKEMRREQTSRTEKEDERKTATGEPVIETSRSTLRSGTTASQFATIGTVL